MSGLPLQLVDPFRQASLGAEYQGELPFDKMPRLRELLVKRSEGSVRYRLHFSQQGSRRYRLEGEVETSVELPCQRCFRPSRHEVKGRFRFELVETEAQMDLVEEGYDALLVEDERISLPGLLEDEVLLALPAVAVHEDIADCTGSDWQQWMAAEQRRSSHEDKDEDAGNAENPFAVLAGLKDTLASDEGDE
jgi:uncharacterized protein